jgi:hypothetical protein
MLNAAEMEEIIRDTPGSKDAFWAAYDALGQRGVALAQVREVVAERITAEVCHGQWQHGLGWINGIAFVGNEESPAGQSRQRLAETVKADIPTSFSSVSKHAIRCAISAAAKALWEYKPTAYESAKE